MKYKKYIQFILLLMINLLLVGCEKQVTVDKANESLEEVAQEDIKESSKEIIPLPQPGAEDNMSSDFYLIIEDIFSLADGDDLVIVGVNKNSVLCSGAQVDIISSTDRIQTQVLAIEVYDLGIVDSVESDTNIGIMLDDITKNQVNIGDLLVLRDKGMVTNEATALSVMLPVSEEQTLSEFTEGQKVKVRLYDSFIDATVTFTETISEEENEDMVFLGLNFEKKIACQNHQTLTIADENGDSLAVGYFMFEEE